MRTYSLQDTLTRDIRTSNLQRSRGWLLTRPREIRYNRTSNLQRAGHSYAQTRPCHSRSYVGLLRPTCIVHKACQRGVIAH